MVSDGRQSGIRYLADDRGVDDSNLSVLNYRSTDRINVGCLCIGNRRSQGKGVYKAND